MITTPSPTHRARRVFAAALLCLVPAIPALADEVDECGALVASPYEAGHRDTGVDLADARLAEAEEVCNDAISANPDATDAMAWLARIHYYYGEYEEAQALLEPAAEAGNALAQQLLGDILIDGLGGIEVDEARAIELLKASATAGFAPAQNSLGVSYERGQGVPEDKARAAKFYAAASKQGLPVAEVNLGMLYADGLGVPENDERATQLFMSAAEKGDAGGMNSLAVSYEIGEGIDMDLDLAMEWYRKAAAAGSSMAQANIGNLYAQGLGVEQDDSQALKWISKSASSGNAYGQFLLGDLYENGQGVTVDLDRAIEIYREAAAGGNTRAEDALIRLGEAE
jgi:TPR repeat protein